MLLERYTLLAWPDLHGTCRTEEKRRRYPWAAARRGRVVACVCTGTLVDLAFTICRTTATFRVAPGYLRSPTRLKSIFEEEFRSAPHLQETVPDRRGWLGWFQNFLSSDELRVWGWHGRELGDLQLLVQSKYLAFMQIQWFGYFCCI